MSRPSSLHRLQEVDLALDRVNAALQEVKDKLEDKRSLQLCQEALDAAEERLQRERKDHNSAEHAAAIQRAKIADTEKKLYGGMIRNPKELQDLQQESISLKRHLAVLEDRLLDSMVALEEAELLHSEAIQAMADAEKDRSQLEQELGEARAQLSSEAGRLEIQREAGLASVAEDDLTLYERLRSVKGGRVVSLMQDGCCSACGMSIPPAKQQAVRSMTDLLICSQCGRVLYAG